MLLCAPIFFFCLLFICFSHWAQTDATKIGSRLASWPPPGRLTWQGFTFLVVNLVERENKRRELNENPRRRSRTGRRRKLSQKFHQGDWQLKKVQRREKNKDSKPKNTPCCFYTQNVVFEFDGTKLCCDLTCIILFLWLIFHRDSS